MRLLIGYDGSECADAALNDLRWAGLPQDVEAVVLSAADVWLSTAPSESEAEQPPVSARVREVVATLRATARQVVAEARGMAEQAAARLQKQFPTWKVQAEACADSPAWAILKKAEAWKPDLIVVGSHGQSAISGLLLGSVSQRVLIEASCSVRIARRRAREEAPEVRLVIGVDGSFGAEAAVHVVTKRVWPAGSSVCIVAARDPALATALPPGFLQEEAPYDGPEAWIDTVVEAAAERLRRAGLNVTTLISEGDPKQVLREEIAQWPADGLFVGACGLRGMESIVLGSVSTALAVRAPCSVEIVRTKEVP